MEQRSPLSLAIFDQHRGLALRVIERRVGNRAEAEDIVQTAMVKLLENPPEETVSNPGAYLIKIGLNLATDRAGSDLSRCFSAEQPRAARR
ncbi:MAG: sigma factor [Pseudomonadota bacterium]